MWNLKRFQIVLKQFYNTSLFFLYNSLFLLFLCLGKNIALLCRVESRRYINYYYYYLLILLVVILLSA